MADNKTGGGSSHSAMGLTHKSLWESRTRNRFLQMSGGVLVLLAAIGALTNYLLSRELMRSVRENLTTIRDSEVGAVREWYSVRQRILEAIAKSVVVRKAVAEGKISAPVQAQLNQWASMFDAESAGVVDASGSFVWSGDTTSRLTARGVDRLKSESTLSPPLPGGIWGERPAIIGSAPIPHSQWFLVMRFDPQTRFSAIMAAARAGQSGETYAFDVEGNMLSQGRFLKQLTDIQLLPAGETSTIFRVQIRDPGENLMVTKSKVAMASKGLTRAASAAVSGESGVDVNGYRDYRGVPVVGAWEWLPEFGFGMVTEIDVSEAYRSLTTLRGVFFFLFGILVMACVAALLVARGNANAMRRAQHAEAMAEELGQYQLDEKIGEGGMSTVYRAHHKMLRRPTAIKTIRESKADAENISRFEREVRLTCGLSHPNTIAIYDYGRTATGSFYYAMEFLEGADLGKIVEHTGPLPPARVVHILVQGLGALSEAHDHGLIHRDIKPGNLFCAVRGGMDDFVKVLDFGLVKQLSDDSNMTRANAICGTPQTMSPEAIEQKPDMDGRVDTYAMAVIGYYLLIGKFPYDEPKIMATMKAHLEKPVPSLRDVAPNVPEELAAILERNMAKDPKDRHTDARAMAQALAELVESRVVRRWTQEEAHAARISYLTARGGNPQEVTSRSLGSRLSIMVETDKR